MPRSAVKLTDEQRARLATLLWRCRDRPDLFHTAVLGRPAFHAKQRAVSDSIVTHRVVVVPGAHSVGKSWMGSSQVLWWLYTRRPAKVLTTSPSYKQLSGVIWSGIRAAYRASPILPLLGDVHLSEGGSSLELRIAPDQFAAGYSTKTPENLQGFHNAFVLTDESSGIDDGTWEAIHSYNNAKIVAYGNPIRISHFKTLYGRGLKPAKNPGYISHRLTAWDSPHAHLTDLEIAERGLPPGLTSKTWIDGVERNYGRGSLYWTTRVEAEFPDLDTEQLLPDAWVDACVSAEALRYAREHQAGAKWMGVDPSGGVGADKSAIVVRDNNAVREVFGSARHGVFPDSLQRLEPVIADMARRHAIPGPRIVYDANGVGRPLGEYLAAPPYNLPGALPFFTNETGGDRFGNLRTAVAFALRRRLDPTTSALPPFAIDGCGDHWIALREELLSLRTRLETAELDLPKESLEPKKDLKARLGRSPDFADALLMTCVLPDW